MKRWMMDRNQEAEEDQEFPIMHWEELSRRITELEKQEEERRGEKGAGLRTDVQEEEEDDVRRVRVAVGASRLNHRNLQLCFINNSDSEDEEEVADRKIPMGAGHDGCHGAGLKQEVAAALRALRDNLLAELKEQRSEAGQVGCGAHRKPLECWELQRLRPPRLVSLKAALQQEVHALSSELVSQLLVRDQLRTKQDAMLLDVQDLT